MPKFDFKEPVPLFYYLGRLFVAFYVLSITWVAPKFGIANSVSLVLLGQLISTVIIDHYGLLGTQQYSISIQRLAGLTFMTLGVLLVVKSI